MSRKEIPHSNFLSWLFNNQESHQLGMYAIKKLLDIYVLHSKEENSINKNIFDLIITDSLQIENVEIEIEKKMI